MALPPGFLDELRGRLSLSQVAGRKVMWDARKSNPGKGDMWAPCPFHQEKTASFHVDDRKGYYYCFGCHAKGDAISFVRETENVSFIEAVEILAGEAGMPMPERDPRAQEKADRRTLLAEVMEEAVKFFQMQLKRGVGAEALRYLNDKRGLKQDALDRWEIGFAPDAWQALWDHLRGKSVNEDLILAAGLAKPSQKGGKPYDTFRGRIMFPIRDARGRCIAFGGRAMDPNDNAKYLNSPETELFDKGRSLYNHAPAREAAGKGHDLIVAEGYMDVIALSEAGFKGAVAPLGTAITEDQLALLWRMSPEPIIMLDGDTAGQRAANRLIDLALPKLGEANSLFFVTLPDGQDPDDFLKAKGAPALTEVLTGEDKMPLVRVLWNREFNAGPTDTPEQKAGLDKRLRAAITAIQDPDIRRYYGETIKDFRWQAFRPKNYAPEYRRRPGGRSSAAGGPLPGTKASLLAGAAQTNNILSVQHARFHSIRERLVAAIAVSNPKVAVAFREGLELFDVSDESARAVIRAVSTWEEAPDRDVAFARIEETCKLDLENVLGDPYVRIHPTVRRSFPADVVLHEFAENIARVTADRAALLESEEAEEEIDAVSTEALTWRLGQSAAARNEAFRGDQEDRAEYVTGDNGHGINRDEQDTFQSLLDRITYSKGQH